MKKILSMILVLAMLCTALALASCGDDTDGSSDAASSEESVAPPTKAELFETALSSYDTYFESFAEVFAIDTDKLASEEGRSNVTLSVNELSLIGESLFGDDPLKISLNTEICAEAKKSAAVLFAAGDEVKFDIYAKGDKQYITFPELFADKYFDAADISQDTEDDDTANNAKLPDFLALFATLYKEENISISEDGKTYTVTLGKDDVGKWYDAIELLMGITEDMDGIVGLDLSEDTDTEEAPRADSAVFVFALTSETECTMTSEFKSGETTLFDVKVTLSAQNGTTALTFKGTANGTELLNVSANATASEVDAEGKINAGNMTADFSLNAVKNADATTVDGTFAVSVDVGGMMLTIPFEIDGSVSVEGDTYSAAIGLSATMEGIMAIDLDLEMDYTPGDVTVTLPFAESDVAEFDEEAFALKMLEIYPNASVLLGGSAGGDTDDLTFIGYSDTLGALTLNIYSDDTVEIIDNTLKYEKTDDTITFYKNDEAVYTLSYSASDDAYTIYGDTYAVSVGTPEDDGYTENFYCYYDNSTYLDVYLYDDTSAGLSMCWCIDPASDDLVFTLPDGNTLTYDIEMSDDGSTVTFWGEVLTLNDNIFANF